MPTYTLIPDEHDFEPEELIADGPAQLLGQIYGYGWNSAQVLQDGSFVFVVSAARTEYGRSCQDFRTPMALQVPQTRPSERG